MTTQAIKHSPAIYHPLLRTAQRQRLTLSPGAGGASVPAPQPFWRRWCVALRLIYRAGKMWLSHSPLSCCVGPAAHSIQQSRRELQGLSISLPPQQVPYLSSPPLLLCCSHTNGIGHEGRALPCSLSWGCVCRFRTGKWLSSRAPRPAPKPVCPVCRSKWMLLITKKGIRGFLKGRRQHTLTRLQGDLIAALQCLKDLISRRGPTFYTVWQ